jgi:PAS domain S-box-containing protein
MRNVQVLRRQRSVDSGSSDAASGLMRILVLDDDSEIIGQLENALWVWPHKLTQTANVKDAVRLCQHLIPSAILVAVDRYKASVTKSIPALRRRLPTVPIIAVVSRKQFVVPGKFLDQGADALLMRDNAYRPTLHDLIISVRRDPDTAKTATRTRVPVLALPWRQSKMLGALICDVTGSIVDANRSLATWLGYPNTDELRGRNVLHDLLKNRDDWISWKQVAGDTSAIIHQETAIAAKNGQVLWTKIEVFAAPSRPSHLQAIFVDLTELAMLTGREK